MSDATPGRALHRRSFLKYTGAFGAATAITTSLSACSSGPESTNDTGGGGGGSKDVTAVIGYGNDQSWDPLKTASAFSMAANHHIFEGLCDNDPISRKPYAALATAIPADPQATTWRFTLREGAKWHDGQPVTADDVVFTYDKILDTSSYTLAQGFFASWLKSVKKVDAKTVELTLKFPFPDGTARLTLGKILPKHIVGKSGGWETLDAGKAIGSGPYKQTAHHPKSNTTFAANPDYNGPRKANFDTMNWLAIVDAAPRVAKISGNSAGAQIADNIPYPNIEQLQKSGLTVEGGAGMNHIFLLFNTAHKPFDDVRVRQALFYAIDTEKMIQAGLRGHGKAAQSFLDRQNPTFRKAKTVYTYDPDKAKQLLARAGVKNLKVNLLAGNVSWIVDCLPTIKASWDAVGVKTTLDPQETSAVFSKLDQKKDFQVVASASNPNQFGIDADLIMRYNYSPTNTWTGYARWQSNSTAKALFKQMDQATRESDPAKKKKMTQDYIDVVAENAVIYPIVHTELMTAWDPKKITGVRAQSYPGINLLQAKPAAG
ncbi:ABC transporter substrate-binding protein [Streptomyces sp. NPDC050560]|uniref:ABC transporter substrate-binding protein n=1 Tax=Streptomyces sp. NPDC050560 TaxID=3365630 RepID=UPI0037B2E32C